MSPYRCYVFNDQSHIVAVEILDCETDQDARQRALALWQDRKCHRIEIWDGERLLDLRDS